MTLTLNDDVVDLYEELHGVIVNYRREDQFEEVKLRLKSKSLGLVMRFSGFMSLFRMAVKHDDDEVNEKDSLNREDFEKRR